ncbi:MAG: hypothetical protein KGS47_11060 [Chloroflexi bacterium]|nr:hypothetical protein [Chloroflexota bacterium]
MRHGSGATLDHGAAGEQRSALRAIPRLLAGHRLADISMTSDARHIHHSVARAIHTGGTTL